MNRLLIVVTLLAACRSAPHVNPGELEQIAYKVVSEDNKPLAYVVYPPRKRGDTGPRPPPKLYDLEGYRIFLIDDAAEYWGASFIGLAEMQKRTTIVAGEFLAKDISRARRAPPGHVEEGNELTSLHRALHPEIRAAERVEEARQSYKRSCLETLRKILRLAEEGDLAYIPGPFRAEIRKVIDSDDYYDLCRAFNAMIAVGIVAQAYELERERLSDSLDEPWLPLDLRVREAIERHKQAGGTVRILARPQSFP